MDDCHLLKKLLLAVAFKMNVAPDGASLERAFEKLEVYDREDDETLRLDALRKMLDFKSKGGTKKPTKSLKILLKYFNWVLFSKKGIENYEIQNLNVDFDNLNIEEQIKDRVNEICHKEITYDLLEGLIAPDFNFDGTEIDTLAKMTGAISPAYLYQSQVSPQLWDKVKVNHFDYPLYNACEKGLIDILNTDEWRDRAKQLQLIFNLGAGGASKDRRILSSFNQYNITKNPAFIWIDSSRSMLWHTMRESVDNFSGKISCNALNADFEKPFLVKRVYSKRYPTLPPFDSFKAFFILGFTLSNLDEISFFSSYKKICKRGDLFIFPMQFIPEKYLPENGGNIGNYKKSISRFYDFEEGKQLAREGLIYLRSFEVSYDPKVEIKEFILGGGSYQQEAPVISLSIDYVVKVKNKHKEREKLIITSSRRHFENVFMNMLEEYNFHMVISRDTGNDVKTLMVEYVGN